MIRHLLKLVWNRKGSNILIILEIFVSFLVVFSLAATGLQLYSTFGEPLGYDWRDVWSVRVERYGDLAWDRWTAEDSVIFGRLMKATRAFPEVISVAGVTTGPYSGSKETQGWESEGASGIVEMVRTTPELADALGIEVAEGRWLEPSDEGLEWIPAVVDRELAHELVGDLSPVGRRMMIGSSEHRVVGVVEDFRREGELLQDGPLMLALSPQDDPSTSSPLSELIIRLAPGTSASFEESLLKALQTEARGWSFEVTPLETARDGAFRERLVPVVVVGVVAAFLIFMVVLGLTGVMWQNVTRRTREFGLRRAVGAHRARIQRQIVGEVAVTAGLGVLAGSALALQVPLAGPFTFVPWAVVIPALVAAAFVILILAAICGLHPGWSATRIHPAEALHYE